MFLLVVFCCKQKTAYEMRISDWSSDVGSSDLASPAVWVLAAAARRQLSIADPDGAGSNAVTLNSLVSGPIAGAPVVNPPEASEIGRASCRERVCQYV